MNDPFAEALADRSQQGLRRELREVGSAAGPRVDVDGRSLVCLCSNNYLGLAHHPQVVEAVQRAARDWGWGAGASRLVAGHMSPHARLECRLAKLKRTEAALVCSTGFQANLAALTALAGPGDAVLMDKLNHASLIDAARACGAVVRVFAHKDHAKLERLLQRTQEARRRVIVTDSVFSMDGDFADVPHLVELKNQYDAWLMIDEAHATGVLGEHGAGLAERFGCEAEVDVTVGTLSKALGGMGGFIAGRRSFIDWVVNVARSFVYTTAIPPAACAGAEAALDIVAREPQRRQRLLEHAAFLREALGRRGYDTGASESQIIPIILGSSENATSLSHQLERAGFWVPAIRPPTVPRGRSRLRVSVCADHERADLETFLQTLDQLRDAAPAP